MSLKQLHLEYLAKIEECLVKYLTPQVKSEVLLEAMQYSSLDGGKRIRPLLTIATGIMYSGDMDCLVKVASAIELIHCYSLIHDDLPAMDDDSLRRGRATCHKRFNEAIAILAGDALQSLAFELLSDSDFILDSNVRLKIINLLAKASGVKGMAGGQAIDLINTGLEIELIQLQQMHQLKTGSLIEASILGGYLCGSEINQIVYDKLYSLSVQLGLLFQIIDDIIDVVGSTEVIGKTAHKDEHNNKATYVTLLGLDKSRDYAKSLYLNIINELNMHDNSDFLKYLVDIVYYGVWNKINFIY